MSINPAHYPSPSQSQEQTKDVEISRQEGASATDMVNNSDKESLQASVSHFVRFREFMSSTFSCLWKKTGARLVTYFKKNEFRKNEFCSWLSLSILLAVECYMIFFRKPYILIGSFIVSLLVLIFRKYSGSRLKVRSTVSKLLANAISPTNLGTAYLLTFVIHIGWLGNAVHGLFSEGKDEIGSVLFSTGVCIVGLIALIVFFPDGKEEKDKNAKKIFVSGISSINPSNHNLKPLVSILQLTEDTDTDCELFILDSDYYSKEENQDKIRTNYNKYFEDISSQLPEEYRFDIPEELDIKEKLRMLIKMAAIYMFPGKTWIKDGLQITFSDLKADYNDFSSCFKLVDSFVRKKDNQKHILYFNLTPGTGIVGSLMTLMAIDGDRELYYYSQDEKVDASKRLMPVDKNEIPLKNLLSQALETLERKS